MSSSDFLSGPLSLMEKPLDVYQRKYCEKLAKFLVMSKPTKPLQIS